MAKTKKSAPYLLPIILSVLLFVLIFITYQIFLADKYYPLTLVGNINISFLTEGQAINKIRSTFQNRAQQKLIFEFAQGSATVDLATSSAILDYSTLEENFKQTHANLFAPFANARIFPQITLNIDKQLNNIASSVDKDPQDAKLFFDETPTPEASPSARIQIKEAENGISLNKEKITQEVKSFLLTGKYQSQLPLKTVPPKVTTTQVLAAKTALETTLQEPIKLIFDNQTWTLDAKQLLTLLDLTKGGGLLLDKDQTNSFLKDIAAKIDQNVQEGLFEFNPGTRRVTAFKPSQEGRKLNIDSTFNLISEALTTNTQKNINLPVEIVRPKIATSDVNSLGIKELVGRGTSSFTGSIPNRMYNIRLAASRLNGVLISPGETFSFNQTVGDISAATGYKQAYVIKEGRTVLDDGGGVCQVSTTIFRAVLNAGLPVLARTAHAYRVDYYERGFPPGLDATVFYPSVDFKFKNDTQNYILIQAYTSGDEAFVDLYGTADGRTTQLTKPVITNQIPPPAELRQDDPALPKGTVKQVDWAAWGANVSFKRTVTRNGETIINETWRSNYKPWQAVFLVGTQ
ncbi:VanW family protein [Candidatus Daviesbacteria bacterium]|nr:VanW family protein [Candidatus Daviesbacteria bacterium]